jgi:hypothetical protein
MNETAEGNTQYNAFPILFILIIVKIRVILSNRKTCFNLEKMTGT